MMGAAELARGWQEEFSVELLEKSLRERFPIESPYSVVGSRASAVVFASKSLAAFLGMDRARLVTLAEAASNINVAAGRATQEELSVIEAHRLAVKAMKAGRVFLFAADSKGGGVFIPLGDKAACLLMAVGELPRDCFEALKGQGLALSCGPAGRIEPYVLNQKVSAERLEHMAKCYQQMSDEEAAAAARAMVLGWRLAAPEAARSLPED